MDNNLGNSYQNNNNEKNEKLVDHKKLILK